MNSRMLGLSFGPLIGLVLVFGLMLTAKASESRFEPRGFPLASATTPLGPVWTDAEGMTLYVNLRDRPEAAGCVGECAELWVPHLAEARHRQFPPQYFSVITRPDGNLQWAYRNRPLHRYAGDREVGDMTGHGMADQWWVAQPDPRQDSER